MSQKKASTKRESPVIAKRIEVAREVQSKRFAGKKGLATNADMGARDIELLAELKADAEQTLIKAATTLKLSPRGYHRTIKVARTIADLAGSKTIETAHMLEALQYRAREM